MKRRSVGVTIFATLYFFFATSLVTAFFLPFIEQFHALVRTNPATVLVLVFQIIVGGANLACAIGLLKVKNWARILVGI